MDILYHLTPVSNLASIAEHGLSPAFSREPEFRARSIYFAADPGDAMAYADHHGDGDMDCVLLRVRTADLQPDALGPGDMDLPDLVDNWEETTWLVSLMVSGQCCYDLSIPTDIIEMSDDMGQTWSTAPMDPCPAGL